MTVADALKIIQKTEPDYKAKSRVPKGFAILMQFSDNIECHCEHDQLWTGNFEEIVEKMGEGAVESMAVLGWFEDEESWSHFT